MIFSVTAAPESSGGVYVMTEACGSKAGDAGAQRGGQGVGGREGEADELAGRSQLGGTAGINDLGDFLTVAAALEHGGGVMSRWKQTGAKGGHWCAE